MMKRFTCITAALLLLAGCSSKDRVIEIQSEEDLSGLTIAFASGSYYHDMYGSRKDIGIFAVNAYRSAFEVDVSDLVSTVSRVAVVRIR